MLAVSQRETLAREQLQTKPMKPMHQTIASSPQRQRPAKKCRQMGV